MFAWYQSKGANNGVNFKEEERVHAALIYEY